MKNKYKPLKFNNYHNNYFKFRTENDYKRLLQFKLDKKFIEKYINKGKICDVGCSTGEFIKQLDWETKDQVYGMETNNFAKKIAKKNKIKFNNNIFNKKNYFDLIIFRGTIHHIDEPFKFLKQSFYSLKKGKFICILSTPNINSLYFFINKKLPNLDEKLSFYYPSDLSLERSLKNIGFKVIETQYPYITTPYCNLILDHIKFIINLTKIHYLPHAFWHNSINIIAKKI